MSKLEDFIKENRSAFDSEWPPAGHLERFENKVKAPQPSNSFAWTASVAAVILLLIGFNALQNLQPSPTSAREATVAVVEDKNPELAQVADYYDQQISSATDQLQQVTSPETNALLMKNMSQLEASYKTLSKELMLNPGNPKIIQRMIENYRLRMKLLEQHLQRVQASTNVNNEHHDNT